MTRAELLNLFGQDDDEFRAEAEATLAPTTAAARRQAEEIADEREKFHERDLTAESVPLRPEAWARIDEARRGAGRPRAAEAPEGRIVGSGGRRMASPPQHHGASAPRLRNRLRILSL